MLNAYTPEIVLNRFLIALLNIKHHTGVHTQTHTCRHKYYVPQLKPY